MSCDPNFGDVALLLPFDGANGQTTTADVSSYAQPTTINAAKAALTTTSPKFGTASLLAGGSNFNNSFACQTPYAGGSVLDIFATNEYTYECWFQIATAGTAGESHTIVAYGDDGAGGSAPCLQAYVTVAGDGLTGTISLADQSAFGTSVVLNAAVSLVVGTWYHFAVVHHGTTGNTVTGYLDGVAQFSAGWNPGSYTHSGATCVCIGSFSRTGAFGVVLQVDEFRVTAGVARYTSNFTPPTAAFPTISCAQTVPDVIGLDDTAAQSAIVAANFIVGSVTTGIDPAPPGTVFFQSPVGGTIGTAGDPVDIIESEGILVPDVVNTSATAVAPGIITDAGFVVGTITYASDVLTIPGNVISQNPAAGSFAAGGSPINIVVSTGRAGLLVPLILFLTEAEAIDALVSIGLVPGGISFAPSTTFAAGEVMSQNPSAGNPIAYGGIVGFVVSLGVPIVSSLFDTTPTVISQYANSPTLLQWISNMNLYMDQSANFAKFLAYVWNVNTAIGFGLDILGRIVNVSRLLQIPNTTLYVGFDNGTRSPSDWEPMGSDQPGGGGIGALYSGHNATEAYLLDDDAYRQLILAKAFANICATTAPALNQILQNLYGANNAWVLNTGVMSISYNFRFRPSPIQLAILQQSGVIPTPPGVSVTIVSP